MSTVLRLSVAVPRREVLRYMGYPRSKEPSPRVLARLDALWPVAEGLVEARGAFVLTDAHEASLVGMPSPTARVALAVCTAGPSLEQQEARCTARAEMLDALILDAFGSAAAEAAADALQARICAAVYNDELTARRRVSPGYGAWRVERQADLLGKLPAAGVGVHLTDGFMMIPRKSVSFGALLAPAKEGRSRHRCGACDMIGCRYRRDDEPRGVVAERDDP